MGTALAQQLVRTGTEVLLIEKNRARAQEIGAQLRGVTVVGDGTDLNLLTEEHVADYDLFVAASRDDEVNLMSSLLAKRGFTRTLSLYTDRTIKNLQATWC